MIRKPKIKYFFLVHFWDKSILPASESGSTFRWVVPPPPPCDMVSLWFFFDQCVLLLASPSPSVTESSSGGQFFPVGAGTTPAPGLPLAGCPHPGVIAGVFSAPLPFRVNNVLFDWTRRGRGSILAALQRERQAKCKTMPIEIVSTCPTSGSLTI